MLFNSYVFLFLFLPIVLSGYLLVFGKVGKAPALSWLVLASLFFYGWWHPAFLLLLLASVGTNYVFGLWIRQQTGGRQRLLLAAAVTANLALFGFFKYSGFLVGVFSPLLGGSLTVPDLVLPLGISFFTFQIIAYLVDASRGKVGDCRFAEYSLFVTFFPQLIAGPIVHHADLIPQFQSREKRDRAFDFSAGASLFVIGLCKKVTIADRLAEMVTPLFNKAATGVAVPTLDAWSAAFGYTLQLYFDFSGYSDMAIGLAWMFGIRLPINFFSPYKATSIIDFWRRWHITLSSFLRDYLYIPLGGNRKGPVRRLVNIFLTMFIGGVWHGAGWTFLFWGFLHAAAITVNHLWRSLGGELAARLGRFRAWRVAAGLLTLLFVVAAWVCFRARDMATAVLLWQSMFGIGGLSLPASWSGLFGWLPEGWAVFAGKQSGTLFGWLAGLLPFVFLAPNTAEVFAHGPGFCHPPPAAAGSRLRWAPTPAWCAATVVLFVVALASMSTISEFLYYQF